MAPRAYWKGYLKLSLVSCPIALFPATSEREKISFHQLNKKTGNRIKYRKVDADSGDEVGAEDIVKGYEVGKGEYLEVDPEELEAVAIESSRVIDIDEFVPKKEIDELYLNNPYYIVPDGEVGQQAFAVIREAINKEGMVAIGKVVFTSREHIIALEPRGKGMMGMTLRYPYEVRKEEEYFGDIPDEKVPRDMLELATHIVETKKGHFDPDANQRRTSLLAFRQSWLLGLLSALSIAAACSREEADLQWGANGHPLNAYPGVTYEQQLDYLKDLGMKSYRVNIAGPQWAPALAKLLEHAKAHEIGILPVITPAFDLDKLTAPELYAKAFDLAVALVSQFKNDIRVWELGSAMENYAIIQPCEMQDDGAQYNCAWGPAGGVGPLEYYGPRWAKVSAVLKGLSDGTISVDPNIRKAMGTAGWGHTGAFTRMQQDGIHWDISVWKIYEGDPEWAFKILARFKRPIWITEFNNAGGSKNGEQQQADGLTRMMAQFRAFQSAYNLEAAHIYELMDETYWAPSDQAVMGLVKLAQDSKGGWRPGGPKLAYEAVKRTIRETTATRP